MFGGGVSDKFGNVYEALWAVRQLLNVLDGRKQSIRLEGISPEFRGFEFAVDEGEFKSWHQTKINIQSQNWTIRALEREGVLSAFAARLSATPRDRCVFVSQSPAVELIELSNKAKYASGFADFNQALQATGREKFVNFHSTVDIEPVVAFDWLRRCDFRTVPDAEIKTAIEDFASLLFENDAGSAYPVLRAYLEERLNRELTTEALRVELPCETGLRIKEWSLRPTLRSKLRDETDAYLGSFTPFGASGQVFRRSQSKEVTSLLTDPSGPRVVMVSGVAGSGKSGIVREVLQDLADADVVHLALRVDRHLECKSPPDFGRALLGTGESPVTVLKGLSPRRTAVLIVDQLDAISEISGRNGASKHAVLRMVEEARRYGTVRVVLVCRTFDIENDERIRTLRQSEDFRQVVIPLLDWKDDVIPLLTKLDVRVEALEAVQKELLCLPLNLAVFAEIVGAGETQFASRNDLFEKLLRKKELSLTENRDWPGWALMKPLTRLGEWMSSRQKLDAPTSVLDSFHRSIDILASEHLIVRSRGTVSFFHESFFDYVFARSFASGEQSVVDLLISTEQHLFRRTQVRQILESLRQSDHSRYLRELQQVLKSADVRFHIKVAVAKWLGALGAPTAYEREILFALDDLHQPMPILVRAAVLGTAGWFDILVENGWLARQLESPVAQRKHVLLWWLGTLVGERSEGIASILDAWWHGDQERGVELLDWFGRMRRQKASAALVGLCVRLIASRPPSLFVDGARRELLIAAWTATEYGEDTASILRAYFNAWFEHEEGDHPFARDEIKDVQLHSLAELGKRSPIALLEGLIGALTRAFQTIGEKANSAEADYTFHYRSVGENGIGSDRLLQIIRSALRKVACEDSESARSLLERIDPTSDEAAIHLHLETIAASPEALTDNFVRLLKFPQVFQAGWEGARWKSFADAARETLPYLKESEQHEVEDLILRRWPEIGLAGDLAAYARTKNDAAMSRRSSLLQLSRSGYEQFCILQTIGPDVLSSLAQKRLAELRRKFSGDKVEQPAIIRMNVVESPISDRRAEHMSDANWLKAIEEHRSDRSQRRRDWWYGGARQLAQVLNAVAKADPTRFARLLSLIPKDANPAYADQLLSGLVDASSADLDALRSALLWAHGVDGRPFGKTICRAFLNFPELCEDETCWSALLWYSEHGTAPESKEVSEAFAKQELVTIEHLVDRGGLHIRGINSVRGWALEALAQVLWHLPLRHGEAWGVLERRIADETDLSVACCLTGVLTPMFNVDKERCASLLERLIDQNETFVEAPLPLTTRAATSLLPYIVHQVPDVGLRLLERMNASKDEQMRLVAAWHVMRAGYHDTTYLEWADTLERANLDARRLSADIASDAIGEATFKARSIEQLRRYFDDEDNDVRRRAAKAFRRIPRDQLDLVKDLAEDFLNSRAFLDDSFDFLHWLEEAHANVADLVIAVSERVVRDLTAAPDGTAKHDMALHQLHELINVEYANSEQTPELRQRLLNVIDQMLSLELFGAEEMVKKHER